ncbi:MAG: hypothetical protein RLZZ306_1872 [Bacteroidota bacterium]|jgi:hypothetical protein
MDLHIIIECYIDTKLIKALVPPQTKYNHQKGCPKVVQLMLQKFKDDFAVGIIDRDKKELGYVEQFTLVVEVSETLQLFRHRNKNHYLIFICPAVEKWIISCASDAEILLSDYGLPNDFQSLMKITKTSKDENDDEFSSNFKELFKELRIKNPSKVAVLRFWIEYLKANAYQADLNYIVNETRIILE